MALYPLSLSFNIRWPERDASLWSRGSLESLGWGGGISCDHPCKRVWQGTITADQAPASFSTSWHNILSPSSSPSSSFSSWRSDGRLQFGQVPLVHAVVAHQLVRAGKLLLTVGPAAGKWLLTWQGGDKKTKTRRSLCFRVWIVVQG